MAGQLALMRAVGATKVTEGNLKHNDAAAICRCSAKGW